MNLQPTIRNSAGAIPACEALIPPGYLHLVIRLARCLRRGAFLLGGHSGQFMLPGFGKTQHMDLMALDQTLGSIVLEQVSRKVSCPLLLYEQR